MSTYENLELLKQHISQYPATVIDRRDAEKEAYLIDDFLNEKNCVPKALHPEFKHTFASTEKLFARIGLTPPTAEELTGSGIDLSHLADVYETMQANSLEPRIVLSPTTLSIDQAKDLFNDLTSDKTIPNNPLQQREDGNGLFINPDVTKHWSELTSPDLLPNDLPIHTSADGTSWSIRIIPGTPEPTHTNIAHNNPAYPDKPTITEYLSLQANLIQEGQQPIDAGFYTWLQGTFGDNGSFAPLGRWGSYDGQVYLYWVETDVRGDDLGVRLLRWCQMAKA